MTQGHSLMMTMVSKAKRHEQSLEASHEERSTKILLHLILKIRNDFTSYVTYVGNKIQPNHSSLNYPYLLSMPSTEPFRNYFHQ